MKCLPCRTQALDFCTICSTYYLSLLACRIYCWPGFLTSFFHASRDCQLSEDPRPGLLHLSTGPCQPICWMGWRNIYYLIPEEFLKCNVSAPRGALDQPLTVSRAKTNSQSEHSLPPFLPPAKEKQAVNVGVGKRTGDQRLLALLLGSSAG